MNESAERKSINNDDSNSWGDDPAIESEPRFRMGWYLLFGLVVLVAGLIVFGMLSATRNITAPPSGQADEIDLMSQRKELDKTVWADEVKAQKHEDVFVKLWDDLRSANDKMAVLAGFSFEELMLGDAKSTEMHDWEIENIFTGGKGRTLDPQSWKNLLNGLKQSGYRIVQTEWHHSRFKPQGTEPARSTIAVTLHIRKEGMEEGYSEALIIRGDLQVEWMMRESKDQKPRVNVINAREMSFLRRRGAPVFAEDMAIPLEKPSSALIPVLLVSDLDQDGLCDVLLPGQNLLLRNRGDWEFDQEKLLAHPIPNVAAAIVGDFTCDSGWTC